MHTWAHSSTPYIRKDPLSPREQNCRTLSFHFPQTNPFFPDVSAGLFSFISATLALCHLSNLSFSILFKICLDTSQNFSTFDASFSPHPHPRTFYPLFCSSWGLVSQHAFLLALHSLDSLSHVLTLRGLTESSDDATSLYLLNITELNHYSLWLLSSPCALSFPGWFTLPLGDLTECQAPPWGRLARTLNPNSKSPITYTHPSQPRPLPLLWPH